MTLDDTSKQRSYIMSRIRSQNTSPEMRVRSQMHRAGYRYRTHVSALPGSPDIVMRRYRTVIFINGCFWHQHQNCKIASLPKTNTDYWSKKFERTKARDQAAYDALKRDGWVVLVIWECQTREEETLRELLTNILPARK